MPVVDEQRRAGSNDDDDGNHTRSGNRPFAGHKTHDDGEHDRGSSEHNRHGRGVQQDREGLGVQNEPHAYIEQDRIEEQLESVSYNPGPPPPETTSHMSECSSASASGARERAMPALPSVKWSPPSP